MSNQDPTFYALFDGEDVNGKRYGFGEKIDADVPEVILTVLRQLGRISETKPVTSAPIPNLKPAIDDMDRSQLEDAATTGMKAKMAEMSDDDLRKLARDVQSDEDREAEEKAKADAEKAENDADADADATTDPDKPKRRRTSTEG